MSVRVRPYTEAAFLRDVLALATLRGWRVSHQRPGRTAKGWRTAIQGHAGFPDLLLVRNGVLLVAELKTDRGRVSVAQAEWLNAFHAAGIPGGIWRPRDWPLIEKALE